MSFSLKALAAAALLAIPASAQAQIDAIVPLDVVSQPFPSSGTNYPDSGVGGGFLADFTIDFPGNPSATFNDYLIWCIDANRQVSVPGSYTYAAYDAFDFAENTNFGGANGYNVTVADMRKIVGLVGDLTSNWASYSIEQRQNRQGSIWALFRGESPVLTNIADGNINDYMVLFNGQNQTFVTYVPEPADSALFATAIAGMVALLIVRRRRA